MNIVGIDPGINGGLSLLTNEGQLVCYPMAKTEHDTYSLLKELINTCTGPVTVYLEQVHSMPQQGVVSTFTFGKSYGFIRGCLVAFNIRIEEVTPQKWQGFLNIPKRDTKKETKGDHKIKLLGKAQQLFPSHSFTLKTCDSALIAEYGKRVENIIKSKEVNC